MKIRIINNLYSNMPGINSLNHWSEISVFSTIPVTVLCFLPSLTTTELFLLRSINDVKASTSPPSPQPPPPPPCLFRTSFHHCQTTRTSVLGLDCLVWEPVLLFWGRATWWGKGWDTSRIAPIVIFFSSQSIHIKESYFSVRLILFLLIQI